ncbi:alkaline phosphatase D family protein [Marinagarivorans algicola]|uniref:alkaline phosphatase D family protein n=1 Tax=Marinagarivorans algicola TaxID=1513270 RepID=UPI000A6EEE00|nr:alkaline phosphatase D family protein [Marinagarivorans algicola]
MTLRYFSRQNIKPIKSLTHLFVFIATLFSLPTLAAPEVHYEQCKQTFSYRGNQYKGTTNKDNGNTQWCYLKSPVNGSNWGNVREETIPRQITISGNQCSATSQYGSEVFHGCSTQAYGDFWCYTDSNGSNRENCRMDDQITDFLSHIQPQESELIQRVAVGSCFKTQGTMSQAMSRIIASKPDLFMWLGDNIYADTTNMNVMQDKYDNKKKNRDYQKFLTAKIPVLATWDDHDFGANNAGNNYSKRKESQQQFLRHFDIPTSDIRYSQQEGIYSAVMQGPSGKQVHSIMLDARYFRSPTFRNYGTCQGDNSTVLGDAQWAWLEQELEKPSQIKIIASGIQVLPPLHRKRNLNSYCAYGNGQRFNAAINSLNESNDSGTRYESWAEIPQQREKLLRLAQKAINSGKAKHIIFVSGDQHWGELLEKSIPASTTYGPQATVYEITASGFGQNWPYDIPNPNRLRIWADDKGDGDYRKTCKLPFKASGRTYDSCITQGQNTPWCYTQVNNRGEGVAGAWGNCAPEGAITPTGQVGKVPNNLSRVSTADRHIINKSGSNYGQIDIDWTNGTIKLSLQTETQEITSTIINF